MTTRGAVERCFNTHLLLEKTTEIRFFVTTVIFILYSFILSAFGCAAPGGG